MPRRVEMIEIQRLGECRFHVESNVEFRVLKRIMSAVRSILDCSNPEVWAGKIMASAQRLNSPYVSRKWVTYSYAWKPLPEGVLFAQSYNYALLIGPSSPDDVLPPFPKAELVSKWEGGRIPFPVVEPILRLARELGLRPEGIVAENSLIHTWVLSPLVAGWHYGAPIFVKAKDGFTNEVAEIKGEEVLRQGSLIFVRVLEDLSISFWTVAQGKDLKAQDLEWFFNHYAMRPGAYLHVDEVLVTQRTCRPVAVRYNGASYACVAITGPAIVWARDHEPVSLPDGDYFALHPLVDD
jgi:hypothetical protein